MKTVGNVLRWRTQQHPDEIVITEGDTHVRWDELNKAANQVANALIATGVAQGEHVCVLAKTQREVLEIMYGVAKAGGVFTPVNWRLAPPEIAFVVNDAEATVLFVGQGFEAAVDQVRDEMTQLKTTVFLDRGTTPRPPWVPYTVFRASGDETDPHRDTNESETAWQLYTSGTTGLPKGAELTHHNLSDLGPFCNALGSVTIGDAVLCVIPFYHIAGAGYCLGMMYNGCRLVMLSDADPGLILSLFEKEKIQHTFLVPALLNFLLQHPNCATTDFSSLKGIVYGASPIPEALLTVSVNTFGCDFFQVYGLTETSGGLCILSPRDHEPARGKLKSCGLPLYGVTVRVVDDNDRECEPGQVGQITARGLNIMKGYWHRPEQTAQVIRNGWFYTGDAGYKDKEGYVYIHDRVKDMIISGGENIYPAEVEACLFAHEGVADAAVIGVPSEKWGETVKAVVVPKQGAGLDEQTLIAHCRERIAHYKCPTSIDFTDILPRNPTGKLLKRELRKPYWQDQDRQVG